MKILCTKKEFAQIVENCAFNRIDGDECKGCFFGANGFNDDTDACAAALIDNCEIVPESEAE